MKFERGNICCFCYAYSKCVSLCLVLNEIKSGRVKFSNSQSDVSQIPWRLDRKFGSPSKSLEGLYRQSSACSVGVVIFLLVINDICTSLIALRTIIVAYHPHWQVSTYYMFSHSSPISWRRSWEISSSVMCHCVIGWKVMEVLKK